jgi:hypothetical protein
MIILEEDISWLLRLLKECPKGWAKQFLTTESTEFTEKNKGKKPLCSPCAPW